MIYKNVTSEDIKGYANFLTEIMPKQEVDTVYSKGFIMFNKMTKKQQIALCALHGYNQTNAIAYLNQELKNA